VRHDLGVMHRGQHGGAEGEGRQAASAGRAASPGRGRPAAARPPER
jgi:hypothetical protein